MAGIRNEVIFGSNVDFTGAAIATPQVTVDGQLLIGSTIAPNIRIGTLTSTDGSVTFTYVTPNLDLSASSTATAYTPVTFVMSPYTVLATDAYLGVATSGGAITILLPNAPALGRIFQVTDATGNAVANPITVTTVGGIVLINGAATFPINGPFGSFSFIFNNLGAYEVF